MKRMRLGVSEGARGEDLASGSSLPWASWRCGREADCFCSSSHQGYGQMHWLLLSKGAKGVASPPTSETPSQNAQPPSEDVTPSSGIVTPQPPGLRHAGTGWRTCGPVAGWFDQGRFGSASPPARRGVLAVRPCLFA